MKRKAILTLLALYTIVSVSIFIYAAEYWYSTIYAIVLIYVFFKLKNKWYDKKDNSDNRVCG